MTGPATYDEASAAAEGNAAARSDEGVTGQGGVESGSP
jgi:hypothetical protein